ncbi:MAG: TIM barrel protein [Vicingaceae bacterium]
MIYVSSACVRNSSIAESVEELAKAGFTAIELSGGTQPYAKLEDDLLRLQEMYGLAYLCHNYFPPPPSPFVLNLGSLDPEVEDLSMQHAKKAIDLSKKIGAKKYGLHAAFLFNIPLKQIGKEIEKQKLFEREAVIQKFNMNLAELNAYAGKDFSIYIENNVLSQANLNSFGEDPFLFTHAENLSELDFPEKPKIILDLAHLKVSCSSLKLNFESHCQQLLQLSDYIHISDNDGLSDSNGELKAEGAIAHQLKSLPSLKQYDVSIEVYDGIEAVQNTYQLIENLVR